ncbi:hypothetical protein HHI36_010077 [Cryptolaemus montrouzieri]|uniref:Putative zinc-finger domain-containing protein n=1 Tax=Cryptolaemus montrouzieri TaxID=559131 RepID=A0ABD2MIF2_9CUCU
MNLEESMEREEGEIFDDDLEAISDDSIIVTPALGKLNSHKESLCALSLSSVSDMEGVEYSSKPEPATNVEKKRIQRRKSISSKKRRMSKHYHRHRSDSSSDSDDNVSLTKKLLKEAIRIDSKESHNNSLRTRLRGMVTKSTTEETIQEDTKKTSFDALENMIPSPVNSIVDIDSNVLDQTLSSIEIVEKDKECLDSPAEQENDSELIQLRLEALKTAVINKYHHRKKRKTIQDSTQNSDNLEINKENSCDNVNINPLESNLLNCEENFHRNEVIGNSVNNSEEDEDEDILRAVLLASIAKKITNKVSPPSLKTKVDNKTTDLVNASKPPKVDKSNQPLTLPVKKNINVPKIPRFIISVNNSDSNSDDNSIREESEQSLKKKCENIKQEQKKVENEVDKFLKQQRAEVEAKQKLAVKVEKPIVKPNVKPVTSSNLPETNSLYKLLPKSKQLEYEKLIQKLKSAEKKPRIRRLSNRALETKSLIKNSRLKTSSKIVESTEGDSKLQMTETLQRTLKDMQTHVNGRLQIKRKYHGLTPLLRKVNAASQEQKKHESRIKYLLTQLKEARNQYQKSQQDFHEVLKEFFKKKDDIDKRPFRGNIVLKTPVTSTPNFGLIEKKKVVSNVSSSAKVPQKKLIPIAQVEKVQCKVVLEKCPVNLTDPNDIEFKKVEMDEAAAVPKYTSPLDNKGSLSNKINPLEILCPFEINGSCRDTECTFNHCNKDL